MGRYFDQDDVFPHIESVIDKLCERSGIAAHYAIVVDLINHPKGSLLVEMASRRDEKARPKQWMAGNMVDWLSAHYDKPFRRRFKERFDRKKHDMKWAYFRRERSA